MTDPTLPPRRRIAGERTRATSRRTAPPLATTPAPTAPVPTAAGRQLPTARPTGAARAGASKAPIATEQPAMASVPTALLAVLAVLLVAALAFDAIMFARSQSKSGTAQAQTQAITQAFNTAPAAAEKAAVQILSYDYKTLQQDADEAKTFMTPQYATKYQSTVDGLLKAPATKVKAHVEAKVMASGVSSVTPSRVDILMFIDQTSTTTNSNQPQTNLNRVVFTMVKSGDRWLVDNITAL